MPDTTFKLTAAEERDLRGLAALELVDAPEPGMARISVFKQPVLRKAMLITGCYGLISGVLQYLYKTGHIPVEVKNIYAAFLYIMLLGGGLHLTGKLTPARFALILINIVMFQTWEIVFYHKPVFLVFYIVIALWLVLWWTWREPEMMSNLGLRKAHLPKDFSTGILMACLIFAYFLFITAGFKFKPEFDVWKVAAHASTMFSQNVVTYSFLFATWKQLQNKGISQGENILLLALTVNLLFAPQTLAFYAAGTVGLLICVGMIFITTLFFILLIMFTFKTQKNILPAVCMTTACHEVLLIIGVL